MVSISITLSHVGIIGVASHRYLDVLYNPKIKSFKYYHLLSNKDAFESLANLISKVENKKTVFHARRFYWDAFFYKYGSNIKSVNELFDLMPTEMLRVICEEIAKSDLVWIQGDHSHSCFGLAAVLGLLGVPYVISFKEISINQSIFEKMSIDKAFRIIVPYEEYLKIIREKYGIDISTKAMYGDIDWRSQIIYKDLQNKSIRRLSEYDKKIHVSVLADKAVCKKESGSYPRYYYVDTINELLRSGFVVHLHVKEIIKSTEEPVSPQDNPYTELARMYKNTFYIHNPIDLSRPESYIELMKYDLGLLTFDTINDQDFLGFEQYIIPSRYYDYQMAGVVPIAHKGIFKYMETHCDDVIFFHEAREISGKLGSARNIKPNSFFSDIVNLVVGVA